MSDPLGLFDSEPWPEPLAGKPAPVTAEELDRALRRRFLPPEWVYLRELRTTTGYSIAESYLDAWVINCYPSKGCRVLTVEFKTSRADWRRELRQPEKRADGMNYSNHFYFTAPRGLIAASELPKGCGLLEVEQGHVRQTVPAPWRPCALPNQFVAAIARRIAKEKP